MTDDAIHPPLTVMTVNIHKGFTALNRRFILPELRDAVRKVGADVVFLQEVMGSHRGTSAASTTCRPSRITNSWPTASGRSTPMARTWRTRMATTATP
jgi:endonuclease/exonuclease/phosphatase family metal-dependent hydrolase